MKLKQKTTTDRLGGYLTAAVACSTVASTASAAIVYSGLQNIQINQFSSLNIDIDGDALGDLTLKNYVFGGGNYQGASVNFFPGKLVGFSTFGVHYVTALNAGFTVGSSALDASFYGSMAYGSNNPNAQFNAATGKFIGLQFPSGSNNYNAWVRVDVNNSAGSFRVVDWAYENVPGQSIVTGAVAIPEPSASVLSLGALAAGALIRRRKQAA